MKKILFVSLALAGGLFLSTTTRAQYADTVISYTSGSGFSAGYTNANTALGAPSQINPFGEATDPFNPSYGTDQIVSLGAGGSLTLRLSTPIVNNPSNPFGIDFIISGNSGFIITNGDYSGGGITDGSLFGNNTGATRVEVSPDNVNWYTLNPLLAPTVDGLYPTDGSGNPKIPVNPSLTNTNFAGLNLNGIRTLYGGSAGGRGFDLAWAQDTNGNFVNLPIARYVRVDVLSGKSEVDAVSAARGSAPCIAEDFYANPLQNGWRIFGNPNLFQWNSTNQNLEVTWDSSQPNSYFYHPLGTVMEKSDDFSISFDLALFDIGPRPANMVHNFPISIGFQNFSNSTQSNFLRGTGYNSPNLAEFAYFWPDPDYGPTISATFCDTNSNFSYSGSTDFTPLELPTNVTMRVALNYTASNHTAVTTITTNGISIGQINPVPLSTNGFTDYRVGAFAIGSYSDAGQDPAYGGSVLAHGVVDNFVVTTPPPPVQNLTGVFSNGVWQAQFASRTNWLYTLQRTTNLVSWSDASIPGSGNGTNLFLEDTNATTDKAFYRIWANRP